MIQSLANMVTFIFFFILNAYVVYFIVVAGVTSVILAPLVVLDIIDERRFRKGDKIAPWLRQPNRNAREG